MLAFQIFISKISGASVMLAVIVLLSCVLYLFNYKKDFLKIIFSSISAMFITYTLKYFLKIPRPEHMLVIEIDPRFPSGHATMTAVVATLIIYYSYTYCKKKHMRYFLYLCALSWFVLVGYSRIYLQVHYPIDIIIGGIIGVTSTIAIIKIFTHLHYYNS